MSPQIDETYVHAITFKPQIVEGKPRIEIVHCFGMPVVVTNIISRIGSLD
ncbi:hypothetical protein X737_09670 [Mesorhizobium sp. L48C026A00]|nr:hypothetical protein X737_09670 [Mesorhizobium sp. L48C026A00]